MKMITKILERAKEKILFSYKEEGLENSEKQKQATNISDYT